MYIPIRRRPAEGGAARPLIGLARNNVFNGPTANGSSPPPPSRAASVALFPLFLWHSTERSQPRTIHIHVRIRDNSNTTPSAVTALQPGVRRGRGDWIANGPPPAGGDRGSRGKKTPYRFASSTYEKQMHKRFPRVWKTNKK